MIEMFRYDAWSHLRGHFVEVRRRNNVVRRGFIEDATTNSEIMWLMAEGSCTRQMFEKSEDFEVWVSVEPAQRKREEPFNRSRDWEGNAK